MEMPDAYIRQARMTRRMTKRATTPRRMTRATTSLTRTTRRMTKKIPLEEISEACALHGPSPDHQAPKSTRDPLRAWEGLLRRRPVSKGPRRAPTTTRAGQRKVSMRFIDLPHCDCHEVPSRRLIILTRETHGKGPCVKLAAPGAPRARGAEVMHTQLRTNASVVDACQTRVRRAW